MKRTSYIFLLLLISFLTLSACNDNNENEITFNRIDQVETQFDNDNTFIMVIGNEYCTSCKEYKNTTIKDYLQENSHLPVFLVNDLDDNFISFTEAYHIDYSTSPTTYFVKDGVIMDTLIDVHTLEELRSFIIENNS